MTSGSSGLNERCWRCENELPPGVLACPECHSLVHAATLESLSGESRALEAKGDFRGAREKWLEALPLLPPDTQQSEWIREHARDLLNSALDKEIPQTENKWVKKLGPLAPVAILLAKSKALLAAVFKLKFLLTFFAFLGFYWSLYGLKFGVAFAVLILIHEMGHFIDIKRRGLPAEMPVFLPGLGAYVKWTAIGVPVETRAAVSLAGPVAGCIAALGCVFLWWHTGNNLWTGLARVGAFLNVLNLIPVWVLDGGGAITVLGKTERLLLLTFALALWLVLGEGVFFLVAAGAGWRIFTKDMPAKASRSVTACYLVVLLFLGLVLRLVPGRGFGP